MARSPHAISAIIGTASREDWPHVQHRGGPRGFIKVLAPDLLAFADYGGNRQYITVGNLAENDRLLLLLLDCAGRTRLKIWGRGAVIDDDPALLALVRDVEYPARMERVLPADTDQVWRQSNNDALSNTLAVQPGATSVVASS